MQWLIQQHYKGIDFSYYEGIYKIFRNAVRYAVGVNHLGFKNGNERSWQQLQNPQNSKRS